MPTPELPTAPEPAVQRGARMLADGRAEDAVAVLRGVVAEAPIYAAAHVLLAAALDAAGRADQALDVWHRAAFLVPSSPLVQRERRRLGGAPDAESLEPETLQAEGGPEVEVPQADAPEAAPDTSAGPPEAALDEEPDARPVDSTGAPAESPYEEPLREALPHEEPQPADAPPADSPADASPTDTPPADALNPIAGPHTATSSRDLPEGAHLASPDEFTQSPPTDDGPAPTLEDAAPESSESEFETPESADTSGATEFATTESAPAEASAPATEPDSPRAAAPPPVPDWGDVSTPAVTVLPPEDAASSASPPEDPGGWTVLAEIPNQTPASGTVRPAVVPPEGWEPPQGEPEPTHVPDAPTPPAAPSADASATAMRGTPEPALADDLDALIESLETAPRITPDPAFEAPLPDLDGNVDDLASETLAKIYAAQHQYVEAAVVYERLAARTPEQAEALLARADEMRRSAGGA